MRDLDDEVGGIQRNPRKVFDRGPIPGWRLKRDLEDRRRTARKKQKRRK